MQLTSVTLSTLLCLLQLSVCVRAGLIPHRAILPIALFQTSNNNNNTDTNSTESAANTASSLSGSGTNAASSTTPFSSATPASRPPSSLTTLSRSQTSSSSPPANSTATSATSTPTTGPATNADTLDDINTIHIRRLPFITASVSGVDNISSWLSTLGANGKWPDSEVNYATGCDAQRANWPAQAHWQRIIAMSAAFHGGVSSSSASQWVNNPDLRAAITRAMDFWFSNDFTDPDCIDSGGTSRCPCGTPGFWNTNWFSNIIGVPKLIVQSCLLLNDTLTPTQLSNCTNVSSRSFAQFGRNINGVGFLTGANTLDVASIGIDGGLLTVNVTQVQGAYERVHAEVVVQNQVRADGIRADGSFGQHGGIIYNGNYGKDYANDVLALEIAAGGTQFQAADNSRDAFATLIDGDEWMIYRNVETNVLHWDFSVLNRFISFPVADSQATGSIKINITQLQVLGEQWNNSVLTNAFTSLSKKTTNANAGKLNGDRVFYANDYMVHRGEGFVSTLRMYSARTSNTECVNSQNPFGFHLSDGTLYTYMTGSEYEDIAAAWDWNLIPGTTVDYNATPLECGRSQFAGIETYVGGVTNGKSGIGAMRFRNPLTRSLGWQKAWVFGEDDEVHVMVNTISSSTSAPVFSVLDQRKRVGDIILDGSSVSSGNFTNVTRLWHGGVGYVFPQSNAASNVSLSIDTGFRTGNWTALGISTQPPPNVNLFAAWLSHGSGSTVAQTASYTAFPATKDYNAFVGKADKVKTREVRNDGVVSAVFDAKRKTGYAAFWQGGGTVTFGDDTTSFESNSASPTQPAKWSNPQQEAPVIVGTDSSVLLILRQADSGWTLHVSDPSQTLSTAQVTLTLGNGNPPKAWPGGMSRTKVVNVTFPRDGLAGSTVMISLS